jgi:hypothetical protein
MLRIVTTWLKLAVCVSRDGASALTVICSLVAPGCSVTFNSKIWFTWSVIGALLERLEAGNRARHTVPGGRQGGEVVDAVLVALGGMRHVRANIGGHDLCSRNHAAGLIFHHAIYLGCKFLCMQKGAGQAQERQQDKEA